MTDTPESSRSILVTGATGYVGGRLVPHLLEAGHRVRVLVRDVDRITGVPWADAVDVVTGDLTDPNSLHDCCDGIDVIYYLVHSMGDSDSFAAVELECARTMTALAESAGVERLIYLSGLQDPDRSSQHMDSRHAVGDVFLTSRLLAIVFQAGIIVGSGSTSFEMIRHLTDRLPVMITPRFVHNRVTPIAVDDVLHYLAAAATVTVPGSRTWDIGGPHNHTYGEMMNLYARIAGLRERPMLPIPVFSPWLASHWVGIITPVPSGVAKPLIQSLSVDAIVGERDIDRVIPPPEQGLIDYPTSIRLALADLEADSVETHWTDDRTTAAKPLPSDPEWSGRKVFVDERALSTEANPHDLFSVIESVGGVNGWYSVPLLWKIRGVLDQLAQGPGLIRGRRSMEHLRIGDVLDWWTVEQIDRPNRLLLRADMRVSGDAWLEFRTDVDSSGKTIYRQRAIFFPKGLTGLIYWYSILPFHGMVFPTMARNIVTAAEKRTAV
ncbi:SDR family oxidoreductase [Corynebacterium sp. CCM 9204]|uniref:SDR family oxidoreductase n=1 Tax=Corynebacterium sp. CCM 9204 TaxID=3057616 RepID=UPI003525365C